MYRDDDFCYAIDIKIFCHTHKEFFRSAAVILLQNLDSRTGLTLALEDFDCQNFCVNKDTLAQLESIDVTSTKIKKFILKLIRQELHQ